MPNELVASLHSRRTELRRYLVALGADQADVEDLIQDLYIKSLQVTASIVAPQRYLFRMARSLLIDNRRSSERRQARERMWYDLAEISRLGVDNAPLQDRALVAREELRAVAGLIERMPIRTATIFKRCRLGNKTQRCVAAELQISLSSVEKHLQSACRSLEEVRVGRFRPPASQTSAPLEPPG